MASVLLDAEQLQPRLRPWSEALSIAAINGPSHTIISGDPAALEQFTAACDRDGIHIRPIAVDYASHSAQVEPARERLLAGLADLTPAPAGIPLYSTVGEALSADPLDTTTMDADYWYRNLREPVRFHDRVVERLAAGECTFVELSPHPVLAPAITDTLAQAAGRTQSAVIITLHRDRPDQDSLATTLAQLHTHGHSPSWSALYPHARTVGLPTYAFEHRRYWMAPTPAGDASGPRPDRAEHPLLGAVASPRTLPATLATQTPQQRLDTLTAIVTATTAAVLAHPDPARARSRPALQRSRHRLADGPGAAQHPQPTHRPDPAGNPGARPPHPHSARHPSSRPIDRHRCARGPSGSGQDARRRAGRQQARARGSSGISHDASAARHAGPVYLDI